jgi:hypothetical protein
MLDEARYCTKLQNRCFANFFPALQKIDVSAGSDSDVKIIFIGKFP